MLKKWMLTTAGIAGVALASTTYAAYAPMEPMPVQEETGHFLFGLEGQYAQTANSSFIYGVSDAATAEARSKSYSVDDMDWDFVGHVDIGYAMGGDGPDFTLGFTYLNHEESKTNTVNMGTFPNITVAADSSAKGKTEYEYWDLDLMMGKTFTVSDRYHFHPAAGVRYVNFSSKDKATYTSPANAMATGEIKNDFDGIGPRVAVDGRFDIADNFAFVASAGGSLLIGDHDYSIRQIQAADTLDNHLSNNDDRTIVPELDYRLGLRYEMDFAENSNFGIELGYQATNYFDIVDKSTNRRMTNTSGSMSDWGFHGVYLRADMAIG